MNIVKITDPCLLSAIYSTPNEWRALLRETRAEVMWRLCECFRQAWQTGPWPKLPKATPKAVVEEVNKGWAPKKHMAFTVRAYSPRVNPPVNMELLSNVLQSVGWAVGQHEKWQTIHLERWQQKDWLIEVEVCE